MKTFAKKLAALIIIILTVSSISFSQKKYPQIRIIDGDTITLITQKQKQKISLNIIDLQWCDTVRVHQTEKIDSLEAIKKYLKEDLSYVNKIIDGDSVAEKLLKAYNQDLVNENSTVKKKLKNRTTALWITSGMDALFTIGMVITLVFGVK